MMRAKRALTATGGGVVLLAMTLATQSGCTMTHAQRRIAAEQHWNEVRGRIKLQLARQQFEHGLVEDCTDVLKESLTWDPNNADAHILMARCQLEQGKVAAARRSIEEAARLDSENSDLAFVRGIVAERSEKYEDALAFYRQARLLDDTQVDYVLAEAECLVTIGDADEAVALLESKLVDYDNDPSIHALLGEIALREGNDADAASAFRAVLASGRYDPLIAEQYAVLAVRLGLYSDALAVLQPLMNESKKDFPPSVIRAIAESMLALNRAEGAKMTLRELLDEHPDDVHAWFLLAKAGIQSDDLQTLRRCAVNLARIAPDSPHARLIRAYADLAEGNLLGAERSLSALLAVNEADPLVHCMLGQVAERAGDLTAASEHYHRALEIDPACRLALAALEAMGVDVPSQQSDQAAYSAADPDDQFADGETSK